MAVKTGLERRPLADRPELANDAAVDVAFGDPVYGTLAKETQRRRTMTKAQRKQAAIDARRNKITYDLPAWLSEATAGRAAELGCPPSHLAGLLMAYGLAALERGELAAEDYREAAKSPRYLYFLRYERFGGGER